MVHAYLLYPVRARCLTNQLVFVPVHVHVASAMTAVHRDHLVLASNAQWPEIRSLMSQGQIVSADLL